MTLSADKAQRERDTSKFIYLLNAMENAGQSDHPYKNGYAPKRAAVLKYVADLEAAFEAGRRERGWISVEERLPPDGEPVLFGWWSTLRHSVVSHYCAEIGMHRAEDGYWESERTAPQDEPIRFTDESGQVTHWQPLPAPPDSGDKRGAGEDGQ